MTPSRTAAQSSAHDDPAGEASSLGCGAAGVSHTPLPWAWEQCGDKCDAPVIGIAYLDSDEDCKNPLSGHLEPFDKHGAPIEYYREAIAYEIMGVDGCSPSANAAFIVRACNSHYELLGALEAARNSLAGLGFPQVAAKVCDAAIAKARGESA